MPKKPEKTIDAIIGTMKFTERCSFEAYSKNELYQKYEFDSDFRAKFLYVPSETKDYLIAIRGLSPIFNTFVPEDILAHIALKEVLSEISPETKEIEPSAGGFIQIIPDYELAVFSDKTVSFKTDVNRLDVNSVRRVLSDISVGKISRVDVLDQAYCPIEGVNEKGELYFI